MCSNIKNILRFSMKILLKCIVLFFVAFHSLSVAYAEELNIYSSRHYQTDEKLYESFTEKTGIEVNRIDGKGDQLIERLKNEGENSPADIFITVDAGRLWRAQQEGLFQSIESEILTEKIPASFRHPENYWFGLSKRARLIFYNKDRVKNISNLKTYEDLAKKNWQNQLCIRSSSNIYNLSLMASLIHYHGMKEAERLAKGFVRSFARSPQGGDTDQIRAVAAGECNIAVANSYYFVRLLKSQKERDQNVVSRIGIVFPNRDDRGTHVNISGAGVLKYAKHKEAAIRFLEYLVSDEAQQYFALGNNEYPIVENIKIDDELLSIGTLKADEVNVNFYGIYQSKAQKVFDRAGFK